MIVLKKTFIFVFSGKEYDAFIVYNSQNEKDSFFVIRDMIQVLEKQFGYKLFIEDRNALAGIRKFKTLFISHINLPPGIGGRWIFWDIEIEN